MMRNNHMPKKVIFSERAFTTILAETYEKIATETGGVFLGVAQNETYYVIETIDPGPNSIFQTAYFEYDRKYITHLANKVNKLYSDKLDVLGLWHRHPGSLDRFSQTDYGTNEKFASESGGTAISAIVNVDPKFRLTMYMVTTNPNDYKEIKFEVKESAIPRDIRGITPMEDIERLINSHSPRPSVTNRTSPQGSIDLYTPQTSQRDYTTSSSGHIQSNQRPTIDINSSDNSRTQTAQTTRASSQQQSNRLSQSDLDKINKALGILSDNMRKIKPDLIISPYSNRNEDFDYIVGQLYDVIEFCENKDIPVTIEKGDNSLVNLIFGNYRSKLRFAFCMYDFSTAPITIKKGWLNKVTIREKRICFFIPNMSSSEAYVYDENMFQTIWKDL